MPNHLAHPFVSPPRLLLSTAALFFFIYLLATLTSTNHAVPLAGFQSHSQSDQKYQNFTYPASAHPNAIAQTRPKRVAIIGAGASGSAAAFFLRRAGRVMERRLGRGKGELLGEVVVFEKEGYVGGRSTTVHPHSDERFPPAELGASIFVGANKNMIKAAQHFGLELQEPDFADSGLGIWDGQRFLYTTSTAPSRISGWWDTLTALKRFGPLSPYRTKKAVAGLLDKFAHLYDPVWLASRGSISSIEEFGEKVELGKEMTTRYGSEWAHAVGLGERWVGEVMEASTRVNYASDMDQIHALGAAVCMATGEAKQVVGGNWQVFDRMLKDAKAELHLGTQVTDIIPLDNEYGPKFIIETNSTGMNHDEPFDLVFFAAPWHSSPMSKSLAHHFAEKIPYQKYIRLHVTYVATTNPRPDPAFFGLPPGTILPTTILTTSMTSKSTSPSHSAQLPGTVNPPPHFQSITWHTETSPGSGEYTVKVFSLSPLKDQFLRDLLGEEPLWIKRKEWDSYPALRPISAFAPVEPMEGLQYLAAMEPWVSTMETQTLSAREAVARVVDKWWGLGLGECRDGADAWDWTC